MKVDTQFFFALDARVGLAYDTVTGEAAPAYIAVALSSDKQPSSEDIERMQGYAISNLCTHLDVPPAYIQPINQKTYMQETSEDK